MSVRFECITLFDCSVNDKLPRHRPADMTIFDWNRAKNTQTNFDTILQLISLRSQPDIIQMPTQQLLTMDVLESFGLLYRSVENVKYPYWKFQIEVQHASVMDSDDITFGLLYNDCSGVPMIPMDTTIPNLEQTLDTTVEYRNIVFKHA